MTAQKSRPDWLQRHLEDTGRVDPPGFARAARTTYCPGPGCRAVVVRGLDADRIAMTAVVDPEPLGPLGEVLALAAGRFTYDLTWTGGRYELDRRDEWRIKGHPAGTPGEHVVTEHICGTRLPLAAYIPDGGVLARHRPKEIGPDDLPPF